MKRRVVRSWDVFDTLIARRCVHPEGIFELMSPIVGSGFVAARVQAERSARQAKVQISLDDIYDQLQAVYQWTAEQRQRVLELELRLELENVIPVSENMSRVRDGDILVSDMYLSSEFIMQLLRSAGLQKDVSLFVSTHGKADGTMWRQLRPQFLIIKHVGDNPRSDLIKPLRHFIPASLSEASAETPWECLLRRNGAPSLSAYLREMRLRTYHVNKDARMVQRAQIESNFPLLLLSSAALVRWCAESGIKRALMCSRDCVLWAPLAQRVARYARSDLAIEYFLISRVAALKSSGDYLDYASKRFSSDSVVVDLSMTGVSLAGLADRLGIENVKAFVISWQQSISQSLYGSQFQSKAKLNVEYLTAGVIDDDLEAINQALCPSIHDVLETDDGLSVTYASENRSTAVLEAVRVQDAIFAELIRDIPEAVLAEALKLADSTNLIFLVRECAKQASSFKTVISRAHPGAALRGDPNGVKLNLAYATQHPVSKWIRQSLKCALKLAIPTGSAPYRYARVLREILRSRRGGHP